MLFASVLSVATDVGVFEWPISGRAVLTGAAFWQCSNKPPYSDSVADAMLSLIILHYKFTATFSMGIACIGVLDFGPSKKYPPDLIRVYGSAM